MRAAVLRETAELKVAGASEARYDAGMTGDSESDFGSELDAGRGGSEHSALSDDLEDLEELQLETDSVSVTVRVNESDMDSEREYTPTEQLQTDSVPGLEPADAETQSPVLEDTPNESDESIEETPLVPTPATGRRRKKATVRYCESQQ
jgi:hypothetical protein